MESVIVSPPDYTTRCEGPVIFLAGPIQGAPDWQSKAIARINNRANVANPRRQFCPDSSFEEQVEWESHWLRRAGKNGVILFWLANQTTEHPERVYAQTSRFELGEWLVRKQLGGEYASKIVVGIDSNFQGAKYIQYRITKNYSNVDIFTTLEATVESAVSHINDGCDPDWNEFHRLWSSSVGRPRYDKSQWAVLEKKLMASFRDGNPRLILEEAATLALCQRATR